MQVGGETPFTPRRRDALVTTGKLMGNIKQVLSEIVNRLSDLGASLDALEAEYKAQLAKDAGVIQ